MEIDSTPPGPTSPISLRSRSMKLNWVIRGMAEVWGGVSGMGVAPKNEQKRQ